MLGTPVRSSAPGAPSQVGGVGSAFFGRSSSALAVFGGGARGGAAVGGARGGEVLDAQGRRRFHGAFTGGFSAGYFNTVGSAPLPATCWATVAGAAPGY